MPIAARGSIAFTTTRLLHELEAVTCAALAKAAADLLAVAEVIVERDVARHVVIDAAARPDATASSGSYHGRQRLDVDLDRLGGVLCLQHGLCHHEGDGIADEAHLVGRQRRPRRLLHVASRRGS